VVNLWQTEKASIQLNIIEGKIKQEEKSLSWFQQEGKQLMSGRYSYYCSQNGNYKPLLESFKTYQKEVLMQSIFDRI
jgi:hypothetical protein